MYDLNIRNEDAHVKGLRDFFCLLGDQSRDSRVAGFRVGDIHGIRKELSRGISPSATQSEEVLPRKSICAVLRSEQSLVVSFFP